MIGFAVRVTRCAAARVVGKVLDVLLGSADPVKYTSVTSTREMRW